MDTTTGQVCLPIVNVGANICRVQQHRYFTSLQQKFCATLRTWQKPLHGTIQKMKLSNQLYSSMQQQLPIHIVSDASDQKMGHSGFGWLIANEDTILWKGQGLAPGLVEDMHSGQAEAFGMLADSVPTTLCVQLPTNNSDYNQLLL